MRARMLKQLRDEVGEKRKGASRREHEKEVSRKKRVWFVQVCVWTYICIETEVWLRSSNLSFFVALSSCLVECNYITGFPGFCEVTVYAQKRIKAKGARTVWDTAYFGDNT